MTEPQRFSLSGSHRPELSGVEVLGPVDPDATITATLVLRRRAELDVTSLEAPLSAGDFADQYGASTDDLDLVRTVLTDAGLTVTGTHAGSRRVSVRGPSRAMAAIFGTELNRVRGEQSGEFAARTGELQVPGELSDVVVAVLGLDERPQTRAQFRLHAEADAKGYRPDEVGALYGFPAGTDGSGQTVAIIELGGGYRPEDLKNYFAGLKIPEPKVTAAEVDGAKNAPTGDPNSADGEVALDIEVVGALAPGAAQIVYFAPNTDQGFLDAVSTAVHASPAPVAVSISWGQSEDQWTEQARTAMDQAFADAVALGVTVCTASGDNGSTDGQNDGAQHVDFPASSPHALACGGTRLEGTPPSTVTAETVWNTSGGGSTGGGVSDAFGLPDFQKAAGVPARAGGGAAGRGVPDVAGNADPATGYQVLVAGQQTVVGGTSAVAPLWAALLSRFAQQAGHGFGLVHTKLYTGAGAGKPQPGLRDITEGGNGAYSAAAGWDACTGLGVPDGAALSRILGGGQD
ncbi:S53 family peptidase [Amycolatopsis jiangsuensis]|uniref:Kumamolisin n=1 Tax=Amycolatopsis jiangsuensis TaxID=1181879 RepID=A0A840IMS9_9PSEU|nr:S53 family peptidase [Amycolatopsis jiangsuensis]MBB4683250.1 kumamolisin [Amycolatopsis jiangsuensis]